MTVDDLARLMGMREAVDSVALDGETQHGPQPDYLCCLDHARERIAELEAEVARLCARNAELLAVLREVEWVGDGVGRIYGHCPSCQENGLRRAFDCALDAALRGE